MLKTWVEDFVDEDTGEVVSIERNEVVLDRETEIQAEDIDKIIDSGVQTVFVHREDANALAEVEAKEVKLIDKAPRKGAEGLNIAFLHPKSTIGVLTELCEDPNK